MSYRCKKCNTECNCWYYENEYTWKNSVDYRKDSYCSAFCGNKSNIEKGLSIRYCSKCGKQFSSTANLDKYKLYCPTCDSELDKYRTVKCDWCGKKFTKGDSTALKQDKYCSKKCEAHL